MHWNDLLKRIILLGGHPSSPQTIIYQDSRHSWKVIWDIDVAVVMVAHPLKRVILARVDLLLEKHLLSGKLLSQILTHFEAPVMGVSNGLILFENMISLPHPHTSNHILWATLAKESPCSGATMESFKPWSNNKLSFVTTDDVNHFDLQSIFDYDLPVHRF